MNPGSAVLLTGAGFTHNFGGYLAEDLWSLIFNHRLVDIFPRVKAEMRNQFNYESVYNEIINGDYALEEKEAVKDVIREAYLRLDENVRQFRHDNKVSSLVERFAGELGGSGFFFTLNQDIFMERHFDSSKTKLSVPGVNNRIAGIRDRPFTQDYYERLPQTLQNMTEPLSATRFHYVKLHGSLNWKRSDGTDALVIGTYKVSQIEQEPLLNWYFNLFKEELSKGDRKLLIIGYGFADEHINATITDSIKKHGLKVYAISPSQPQKFMERLLLSHSEAIWDNLVGYYPHKLAEIFENETLWKDLIQTLFRNR